MGLVIGPAASASAATTSTIEGSVPKNGGNAFFERGRSHSSGPIKVSMSSYNGCGSQLVMALRNGPSAGATRVTNVVQFKKLNTTYTFTKKGSTSTTIPSGTYYITAALVEPGAGCPGQNQLPFSGKITI
ncbi:hypothetical protein J2X60_000513 [Curtobacterium sp. 320]|nr:hypothetical protein [Curtobacterium sp. 320]MDR6571888.1 hypothetical protein [Curtobacterium sp. 320]